MQGYDLLLLDTLGLTDAHFGDLADIDPVIIIKLLMEGWRAQQRLRVGLA